MRNNRATGRDMLISLAVILVPCALIYAFFSRTPAEPEVAAADWKPVVAGARTDATYQVLAPTNLPENWKPIRARWGDTQLQLGFLSPDKTYYELKQMAGAKNPEFVREVTQSGAEEGTSDALGRSWKRMVSNKGRTHCLVSSVEGDKASTAVACADAPYEAVEAFVGTLA